MTISSFAHLTPFRYTPSMRGRRMVWPILLLIIIGISAFVILRVRGTEETGPPLALCPGPDQYGYRCEPGAVFTYIDATEDTSLYADDGVVVVDLPFPFNFYGNNYQQAALSSNGNIQFTTENTGFNNECLNEGPVSGMGELIAPYWDDLDLTFIGFLETAVSGTVGSRVFVIEWDDVPAFNNPNDRVTFEVQLFEGSNDIVFLYQDVTRSLDNNGRSATIGLQSEILGNTLQFGCNQLSLTNGLNILFPHPTETAQETSPIPQQLTRQKTAVTHPKSDLALLLDRLNQEGTNALRGMEAYWLAQQPQKELKSIQADVNGDGQEELILLLRPPIAFAQYTQLVVFGRMGEGSQVWELWYQDYPLARQEANSSQRDRYYSLESATDLIELVPVP